MSISTELTRLQTGRNKIRAKLTALGLAQSTDKLDALATAIEGITDNGAVSANVKEGETYTIPKGYHNGSGTVSGVAGGGNYTLQSKTVKPTKSQINVTPDSGYYGLSDVTVEAIPENYQDVSSVTATENDVLTGKIFVGPDGVAKAGTMANNGAVAKKLTAADPAYTVPKGYHSGQGAVSIEPEAKSATPTKAQQTISPTEGKVLSTVTVEPIPAAYQDVTPVTAGAADVLTGKTIVAATGEPVAGSMANNGAINKEIDGISTLSAEIPAGYTSGGTVTLTGDIEAALAAI